MNASFCWLRRRRGSSRNKNRVCVLVEHKQQPDSEFAALIETVGIAVHPVLAFSSIHGAGIAAIFSGVILCSSGRSFTSASHFTRAASTRAFLSAALVFRLISNPFSWRSQSIWRSQGRKPTLEPSNGGPTNSRWCLEGKFRLSDGSHPTLNGNDP